MSEYKIKPYDEAYIEKQVEIGTSFAERWLAYGQSSVEQVKQNYSRENFDPDTRLYCFEGDEMVGYIGANIAEVEEENIKRANTRLAFVLPGHEEAFNLLYEQLLEVLKKKGVSEIESPQLKQHDNYYELAEGLGFSFSRTIGEIYVGTPKSFKPFKTDSAISDYNHESDSEGVMKFLREAYPNMSEEIIKNYVNRIPENEDLFVKKVINEGEKLEAFCCAVKSQMPKFAQISTLLGSKSNLKKHIVSEIMTICKEEYDKVIVFLNPNNPVDVEEAKDFMSLGYEKAGNFDALVKKV